MARTRHQCGVYGGAIPHALSADSGDEGDNSGLKLGWELRAGRWEMGSGGWKIGHGELFGVTYGFISQYMDEFEISVISAEIAYTCPLQVTFFSCN